VCKNSECGVKLVVSGANITLKLLVEVRNSLLSLLLQAAKQKTFLVEDSALFTLATPSKDFVKEMQFDDEHRLLGQLFKMGVSG